MKETKHEVKEAYPKDSGRGIARLDPDTLLHQKLAPGDVIEIKGGGSTLAKVLLADRQDWNTGRIRIDRFTRQNAGIEIGERVTIRVVETAGAEKLVLGAPETFRARFGSEAAGIVKKQILQRPVVQTDTVPVAPSAKHPFERSPGREIPLVVEETEPEGYVIVTEITEIEFGGETVSEFEKDDGDT